MIMNGDADMSSYKEYKEKALQNAEVKAEYEALQPVVPRRSIPDKRRAI